MIQKSDGQLDILDTAQVSYQKWQAYTPWPGLYFSHNNKTIQIQSCFPLSLQVEHTDLMVSKISIEDLCEEDRKTVQKYFPDTKNLYIIPHEQGSLAILQIKPEGKVSMSTHAWINGQNTTK